VIVDLLTELARREKEAGIFPEADVDLFMKVFSFSINYYFVILKVNNYLNFGSSMEVF